MTTPLSGDLIRIGLLEPAAFAAHREMTLKMPPWYPLGPAGIASLRAAGIADMPPPGEDTQAHVFTFAGAAIATRCGVVALADGRILADTLDHRHVDDAVMSNGTRATVPPPHPLPGCWLSLLLGGSGNWFHFALMNLGRLALLSGAEVARIDGVLVPSALPPAFATLLDRALAAAFGAHDRRPPQRFEVGPATCLRPGRLMLPLNVAEIGYYLPQALAFLRALAPRDAAPRPTRARRLYIDRSDSPTRPLRNETALIAALTERGFTPVRLAGLDLDAQARLFADAELIVAPHGAGLTNLLFAAPGTRVIELLPDRLSNWCYRRLAAMLGLRYDAIIGRAEFGPEPGFAPWWIPLDQVLAALG